jgi:uncharacterized membrane protein
MTTIWRKLLIVAVVAGVLGMAGIYEIVNWLTRHGVPQMAEGFRERYLTGTAVAVIVAMLILLRSDGPGHRS